MVRIWTLFHQSLPSGSPNEEGHLRDQAESGQNEEVPSDVDKGHNHHQIVIF